jgi:hypothetical protein
MVKVDSKGQGMARDRSQPGILYTTKRASGQVVASKNN